MRCPSRRARFQRAVLVLAIMFVIGVLGCGREQTTSSSGTAVHGDSLNVSSGATSGGLIQDPLLEMNQHRMQARLMYEVTIERIPADATARVWIPLAQSTPHQWIQVTRIDVPGEYEQNTETRYGNRVLYFEASPDSQGRIPIAIHYEVTRFEVSAENYSALSSEDRQLFLEPNRLVPVGDELRNRLFPIKDNDQLASITPRTIYDRVLEHVDYRKPPGEPWGRGDAAWVCESGFGNCTDFHSLFISLCRSCKIPARFEIGFSLPPQSGAISGYHCWAYFADGDHWVPVDVSAADQHPDQANDLFGKLSADRITLSQGRDLQLCPPQADGPVNFLVDPYVEVDGTAHEAMQRNYRIERHDNDYPSDDDRAPGTNDSGN